MTAKKKLVRWSEKEDKYLLKCIKENPWNLHEAFRKFLRKYPERNNIATVNFHWCYLRKHNKVDTCMFTVGAKSRIANRKVIRHNTTNNSEPVKASVWNKLLKLLKL